MHRTLTLLLFPFITSACHAGPYPVSSPYYDIPVGSEIIVSKKLTILPEQGRVYLQGGQTTSYSSLDKYTAHCWFESWKIMQTPQIIEPDTFQVKRSQKLEEYVDRKEPQQFAENQFSKQTRYLSDGSLTAIEYSTVMTIHSDKQANIRRLTCNHWEDPADAQHLTVAQMQSALGDYAQIKIRAAGH